jgi:hypothetical protein
VFTKPEFFGKFYVLNNTKFYIDKIANMITFQAWEDIAMAVDQHRRGAQARALLGRREPDDERGLPPRELHPEVEDSLGAINNRVDAGLKFPQVSQY